MKYKINTEQPLFEALSQLFPDSSKTTLRSWIKEGRVLVDDRPVRLSSKLVTPGQEVTITPRKKFVTEAGMQILYEDRDLVVVDKPEGILSVSTDFEKGETVHSFLKRHYHPRKVFVIHRIDQDTSGLIMFAFTEKAYNALKAMLEKHEIEREYVAIIEGKPEEGAGTWKSYLYEDERFVVHTTTNPEKGRLAITHYTVENCKKAHSWVSLQLETGRKNQIRVHCTEAGHPIAGDKKYRAKTDPIRRLCLHAHRLIFKHPTTKKMITVVSPIPQAFYRILTPGKKHA
jgi:23S rRNA pseudouridine1911/1915/1917 synthase